MKPHFAKPELPKSGAVVVAVLEGRKLSPGAQLIDRASGGAIERAIASSRFKGGAEDALTVLAPAGLAASRVLLLGIGKPGKFDAQAAERFGARLATQLQNSGESEASVLVDAVDGAGVAAPESAARIAHGARLRAWRFDKYRTKEKPDEKPSLRKLNILVADPGEAKRLYQPLDKVADGVLFTRELVSEPANVIYPETLAAEAERLAEFGVEVEVLGVKEMRKLGMGALLGVGQGSAHEPKLVVMQWSGSRSKEKRPLAFIGKGVTFDTGGISIKPAAGMEEMKWDMAGAGAVIGLMRALAGRKAKVNAVGIVGLVENMPSGTAQRPGDIVKSASGQTIEVINTDAEGRLVLADALWYAQDRFKPRLMVDLATLTGAIIISLGHVHAGIFANDDTLAEALIRAGKAVGEPLWRMPLGEEYDQAIKSDAADMKNTGDRAGGSISAAQFLKRFVEGDLPWAHLDIAGMAWSSKDRPLAAKGATGFGVRLLDRFVADYEG